MTMIRVTQKRCFRCNHSWLPRKPGKPAACPKCHSPLWSKPKIDGFGRFVSPKRRISRPTPTSETVMERIKRVKPEFVEESFDAAMRGEGDLPLEMDVKRE